MCFRMLGYDIFFHSNDLTKSLCDLRLIGRVDVRVGVISHNFFKNSKVFMTIPVQYVPLMVKTSFMLFTEIPFV